MHEDISHHDRRSEHRLARTQGTLCDRCMPYSRQRRPSLVYQLRELQQKALRVTPKPALPCATKVSPSRVCAWDLTFGCDFPVVRVQEFSFCGLGGCSIVDRCTTSKPCLNPDRHHIPARREQNKHVVRALFACKTLRDPTGVHSRNMSQRYPVTLHSNDRTLLKPCLDPDNSRESEGQRGRETEKQRQPNSETERQRDRETERQRDRETERQSDRETERQRDRETERQRDRETERQRQRDRETDRQRDRETERHRETERDLETERPRDRETERPRDRETERRRDGVTERLKDGETERRRGGEAERRRGGEAERPRGGEAERQRGREAERQRGREAERQRGREAERQKDRKTERQKDRKTERERERPRQPIQQPSAKRACCCWVSGPGSSSREISSKG